MTRLLLGPFNRVEGDLEVRLDISDDTVTEARVISPLFRGFEAMLVGRPALDALVYAPRICGICSVSQSVASARALAACNAVSAATNGTLAINLIHAIENIADHLTHFYLFFMPDFARETYAGESWYQATAERFLALKGTATAEFLPARAGFMKLMGVLAGKWPHSLAIQPGGSTRAISRSERARLAVMVGQFRRFMERVLFAAPLEEVEHLADRGDLLAWAEERQHKADLARFVMLSHELGLNETGRTTARFMSFGAYPGKDGPLFARGIRFCGNSQELDTRQISEDISHAWYQGNTTASPEMGATVPLPDKSDGYSWCKAPRLDGEIAEVGALARQMVNDHPLIRDLADTSGGNVEARVVARLIEAARLVSAMEGWLGDIEPGEPFIHSHPPLEQGKGAGLTEAARGSLGHWLQIENGKITACQIIAPTTWNFSPRDKAGVPGPLEQALVGARLRKGETEPVAAQHIVRSFDPCMVCTVH